MNFLGRAYIIKGGTADERTAVASNLRRGENYLMNGEVKSGQTLGIYFTAEYQHPDVTMEMLEEAAGQTRLPTKLQINTFERENRFGVFDLDADPPVRWRFPA